MSSPKFKAKPTRRELVAVIQELQSLFGRARASALNDRDKNRITNLLSPLDQGFDLCVESLSFDPPQRVKRNPTASQP